MSDFITALQRGGLEKTAFMDQISEGKRAAESIEAKLKALRICGDKSPTLFVQKPARPVHDSEVWFFTERYCIKVEEYFGGDPMKVRIWRLDQLALSSINAGSFEPSEGWRGSGKLTVSLQPDCGKEFALEAVGENCAQLEEVVKEHLVRRDV